MRSLSQQILSMLVEEITRVALKESPNKAGPANEIHCRAQMARNIAITVPDRAAD
jgi:hypothetical protein